MNTISVVGTFLVASSAMFMLCCSPLGGTKKKKKAQRETQNITSAAFEVQSAFFGDGYPTPFVSPDPYGTEERMRDWGDAPRIVVELGMCRLSAAIRDKPDWHTKMKDPAIRAKWRAEALAAGTSRPEWKLTEKMVDYVLDELHGYSKLIDEETGIQVGCYERMWQSDRLVPAELRGELVAAAARLETVPEEEKDWHPSSDRQVLDLVRPSLYPIVYNQTLQRSETTGELMLIPSPGGERDEFLSTDFAWLPSDFTIAQDGTATLGSSYINNLHPIWHKDMYPVIDKLVSLAMPMWERVLSDLQRPMTPLRVVTHPILDSTFDNYVHGVDCIWEGERAFPPDGDQEGYESDSDYDTFYDSQLKRLPEATVYAGAIDAIKKTVSLSGQTIQVIVKLANIHLTPEKPSYPGGSWHVEGMENERIVSTFIYYYDQDNVTASHLQFRNSVVAPLYHDQGDTYCMKVLYNMSRDDPQCQVLGGVETRPNRCIAFPNIYQHQVQPFKLANPAGPGHRKIVAFFLIDPSRKVPSATKVPPQQREWVGPGPWDQSFPEVAGLSRKDLMDIEQAMEIREKLMKERSRMIQANTQNAFSVQFNLCEH